MKNQLIPLMESSASFIIWDYTAPLYWVWCLSLIIYHQFAPWIINSPIFLNYVVSSSSALILLQPFNTRLSYKTNMNANNKINISKRKITICNCPAFILCSPVSGINGMVLYSHLIASIVASGTKKLIFLSHKMKIG